MASLSDPLPKDQELDEVIQPVAKVGMVKKISSKASSRMGCWVEENGDSNKKVYQVVDSGAQISCYDVNQFKVKYPALEISKPEFLLEDVNCRSVECHGMANIAVTGVVCVLKAISIYSVEIVTDDKFDEKISLL